MMDYRIFQKTAISTYRLTMMAVLLIIIVLVLSYIFMLVFYTIDRNWGIPVILSPTQQKVLAFQSQSATLEANLLKNRVDLATATETYRTLNREITSLESLITRFDAATHYESDALSRAGTNIRNVLQQKAIDTLATEKAARDVRPLLVSVDSELAAGLITRDQAISRRMAIQSMLNASTDSRLSQLTLEEQARLASTAGGTLGKQDATSLTALQSLNSQAQLKLAHAQALIQEETARQSIKQLQATVAENERILGIAQNSPYYQALTRPVFTAFVQYDNLGHAKPGAPVYDCLLQFILCSQTGTVTQVYEAEEYASHPLFRTNIKGKLVAINFSRKESGESGVVFIGFRPLLF
jgi:hypothetical protein